MKIAAIFSDFDGTLCPLEVPREDAYVSPRMRQLLTKVGGKVPIGIVTSKDLNFIGDRVPFAHGVAAVCGLEMQVGGKVIKNERARDPGKAIEEAYREVLPQILSMKEQMVVERKTTEDGDLLAFCIDWRLCKDWPEAKKKVKPMLANARKLGLYLDEPESSPFANVYFTKVEKGTALNDLRKELHVDGPIVYLGDSEADNPAFDVADVSVGVKHYKVMPDLTCKYQVEFLAVEGFILDLLSADFEFSEAMVQPGPRYQGQKPPRKS